MLKWFVSINRSSAKWLERRFPRLFLGPSYSSELVRRIHGDIAALQPDAILEVGGIDRPLISKDVGYAYIGLDIEERSECYLVYDKFIVQTIEAPVDIAVDMVISITLLEHVPDNKLAIRSIYNALKPGGKQHHYVPSKWHPYSLALRIVGPKLQKSLIATLRPGAVDVTGYPAFFDHCSVFDMRRLMEDQGFTDIDIKTFYRANDYFAFFLPAYVAVSLFENLCASLNWQIFASGFVISSRKPL